MRQLSNDEILKLPREDVELSWIEWLADGALRLTPVLPSAACDFFRGNIQRKWQETRRCA